MDISVKRTAVIFHRSPSRLSYILSIPISLTIHFGVVHAQGINPLINIEYDLRGQISYVQKREHDAQNAPIERLIDDERIDVGAATCALSGAIQVHEPPATCLTYQDQANASNGSSSNKHVDSGVMGPPESTEMAESFERVSDHEKRMISLNRHLEIAYQLLNVADAIETIDGLNSHRFTEANPIIGSHPSDAKVIALKALGGLVHYMVYYRCADHIKATRIFEYATVALQSGVVVYNATILF